MKNRDVRARKTGFWLRFIPAMDAIGSHTVVRKLRVTRADHLDPGLVASYLEDVCDAEERSRVEAHLAECTDCCEELIALEETVRTLPTRRKGRYAFPLVTLAAAAAIAGLIVFRTSDNPVELPAGTPIVQRSQPEERSTIAVLGPESGAVVEVSDVILQWAPVEPDARYLVTVTTSDGDSVWARMTPDSAAAIPVALDPGGEYLWYVDALLPGGGTATSGIHHFRVPQ